MKFFKLIKTFIVMTILVSCTGKKEADLIVFNTSIYSVDENFSKFSAMAIKDGKILEIGDDQTILEKYSSPETLNLQGSYVYPGFIDPHCHFIGFGRSLKNADLVGTTSLDDMMQRVKEHHSRYPSEWVLGRGWDHNNWQVREFPHRSDLDKHFPDTPVLLTRVDGHAAVANTEALKRAGITAQTTVSGGSVYTRNGVLTGILIDNAIALVRQLVPTATTHDNINALIDAQEKIFEVGLTSVSEAGVDAKVIHLMDSLQKEGKLQARIYAMLNPTESNFEEYVYKGIYKTDLLNVRSVKLFADGALGSRGAKLIDPYTDDLGNTGILVEAPEFLEEISKKAFEHGYQVNVHCIGDSANRLILNIFASILEEKNDLRWRIEHAQVIHTDDFDLFGKFSIIPSVQTLHATSDMGWALGRLGPERIKGAYAYQQLLEQNGWLPNGSDFPVEPINPLYGFHAAVARQDHNGNPPNGFQMENALTREQALRAMTIWAAKSQFEENEKGSLEKGKFADFVVLDSDLMDIKLSDIPTLKVKYTFLNGSKVFERKEI